jgi:pimeloyl-ACP methyl ester carboxylesterase
MHLHSHRSGHGPPLVLLHGLFGSLTNWLGVSRALAVQFTVFAVDQRNHGRSPHCDTMSYAEMAADLAAFLDDQGLASAHLLGHSLGGKVAMQFALTHPARVKRLIVADISPRAAPAHHQGVLDALLHLEPARFRSREAMDATLAGRLPDATLRRFLLKSVTRTADGTFRWQFNLPGLHANSARLTEAVQGGRPFAKPTLFLRGGRSNYITDGDLPEIRRLFPRATLQTVAGAGHWLHTDAPLEFLQRVHDFLKAA